MFFGYFSAEKNICILFTAIYQYAVFASINVTFSFLLSVRDNYDFLCNPDIILSIMRDVENSCVKSRLIL